MVKIIISRTTASEAETLTLLSTRLEKEALSWTVKTILDNLTIGINEFLKKFKNRFEYKIKVDENYYRFYLKEEVRKTEEYNQIIKDAKRSVCIERSNKIIYNPSPYRNQRLVVDGIEKN